VGRREAGQGFYKRERAGAGQEASILTLDPATMTYRPKQPARLPSLEAARSIEDTGARIKTLFLGKDKVGQFLRDTLAPTLVYTARSRRTSPIRSTTSIAPCDGGSAGSWDRSRSWTPSVRTRRSVRSFRPAARAFATARFLRPAPTC
jgi:hypothetical protein